MLNDARRKKIGALLVVFLSGLVLFIFFNRHVTEANQVSFSTGGDGLKSTFCSLYQNKHDNSYWSTRSMNYPFGESVFYTGNQVFATNLIKVLKDEGLDLSDHTLGILNIWMLLSFVICSLLLYLIFRELDLPPWYAVITSLIITFLSPQLERMGGHYNLAYAWVIPLAIYMMMRFHRKPSWLISVAFGIFIFIIGGKQLYYIPIVGVIWLVFSIYMLSQVKRKGYSTRSMLLHFLVQMIIPFIAFYLFSGIFDMNPDRTSYPWGFFLSTTRLESIFLPLGKPYGRFIHIRGSWRAVAYVGMVSTISFLVVIVLFIRRWRKYNFRRALKVTDIVLLNVFFLGAIIAFLISLGFPFQQGLQKVLNYMGPLRQLRAIGRFIFPFYYILNILSFYLIWNWYSRFPKLLRLLVLMAALGWGSYDAWLNIDHVQKNSYRKFHALNDYDNRTQENQWVKRHDWSQYQAIMPLPYFHVGSENYWYGDFSPAIEHAFIASIKTGLPLNAVMLSRTSISQTLYNLDLWFEPYHEYPVLRYYAAGKPLLLLQAREGTLSQNEKRLVERSALIDSNKHMLLFEFYPDSLEGILRDTELELRRELEAQREGDLNHEPEQGQAPEYYDDTTDRGYIYFESYRERPLGVFRGKITGKADFLNCTLPGAGRYVVSFWFKGTGDDLWPRTYYYVRLEGPDGSVYYSRRFDFFRRMVLRDGDWGLVEFFVDSELPSSVFTLSYQNVYLPRGEMIIDNVLVRPDGSKIRIYDGEHYGINNRYLPAR